MKLRESAKLLDIIKKYSPINEDYSQLLLQIEDRIHNPDIIVPVIGTQGMGKSTIINALVGEDVLPNEADETTCIPVEIRYGEKKFTEVHFNNGTKEIIGNTKTDLSLYVDNNFNPANKKAVSHIVLVRNYAILKSGMVIVDLPGVGSLTKENEETTQRYIKELCATIIVISTTPPILFSEAKFIKMAWRGFNTVHFVQNVWDDNSESEIQAGLAHNKKVLGDIAKEINVPMVSDVIPINAYAALKGAIEGDESQIVKSKIKNLELALRDFARNYNENNEKNFEQRVQQVLDMILQEIANRVRQSELSKEELLKEIIQEQIKLQETTEKIEAQVKTIKKKVREGKREIKGFAEEISEKKSNLLRAELFQLIEHGVVDGEKLSKAFEDYQNLYAEEVYDESYEKIYEIWENIQSVFEDLGTILDRECMDFSSIEIFNKNQALKWEKGMQAGITIGGSLGGALAGFAIGGIVGAVVGIGIALISTAFGKGSKKAIQGKRAEETKREIKPYISQFKNNLEKAIVSSFDNYADKIIELLDDYTKARDEQLDMINVKIEKIKKDEQLLEQDVKELELDREYVKTWRK